MLRTKALLPVAIAFSLAQAFAADTPAERQAREILDAAGVQGGLVVHLDCGDGRLTAALRAHDGFLVQGLTADAAQLAAARAHVREAGVYGKVTVDRLPAGGRLPYIDNLVNLLVAENLAATGVGLDEVMRVLAPGGAVCVRADGQWRRTVKPRPAGLDEWTHYLHDATNNAVAHDTVIGPPRHMQWVGSPRYSRHHDHMSGASAMVTSGGRLFYIFDHASPMSIQLPSVWKLVARDAFNGTILWTRPIEHWHTRMFRLKSGPAQLPRRLVAVAGRVYVTLGLEAPVRALDAVTGRTVHTYAGTAKTEEIVLADGTLFLVINDNPARQPANPRELRYAFTEAPRRVTAIDAKSGQMLWNVKQPGVLPLTLTVGEGRVLFCDGERIVCLDRKTGAPAWKSEPVTRRKILPSFFAPTLVLYDGVALFSGGSEKPGDRNRGGGVNTMHAFDAETGKPLWTAEHPASGYKSAEDILVVQGLVWTPSTTVGSDSGEMIGRDPRTGEVRKRFLPDVETHWFHHRCYRAKATDKYILTSRTGIEFVDLKTEQWTIHHWVRGACLYGILPANGMIYNPPHPCACYLESKLYGFNALAPAAPTRKTPAQVPETERIERGASFDKPVADEARPGDWPTHRSDPARSGFTKTPVPAELGTAWQTEVGGRLSSVVVAGGRLFVASIDEHTVHALGAGSGARLWSFTAGGRVDSPPTIWQGRVLFGSADGHVYCLRADDGSLIWRFRAGTVDRRMTFFEQIESVWPLHGSVLIREGELWCVAGRSMFVDGGMRLLRLDPKTGKLLGETLLDERDPDSGKNLQVRLKTLNMPVALPDVLSYDGQYVYMRSQRFGADGKRQEIEVPTLDVRQQKGEGPHLFCPTGFLDDVWWHRSYWIYGRVWKSGAGGYYQSGRIAPAGRPMVVGDTKIYGYARKPQYYKWTTPLEYHLFASAKQPEFLRQGAVKKKPARPKRAGAGKPKRRRGGLKRVTGRIALDWTHDVPILVRAMVLAGDTLFVAGPPDLIDEEATLRTFAEESTQKQLARQAAALKGSEGAILRAVSTDGGKQLSERKLDAVPVFDGMAAAGGKLYYATIDGKVVCLSGKR